MRLAVALGVGVVVTMIAIARYHVYHRPSFLAWEAHFSGGGDDGEWYHLLEGEAREPDRLFARGSSRGELYLLWLAEVPAQPQTEPLTGGFVFRTDTGFALTVSAQVLVADGHLKLGYGDERQVPVVLRAFADSRRWFSVEATCSAWPAARQLAFDNELFSGAARVMVTDVERGRAAALQKLMVSPDLFPTEPERRTVH